MNRKKQGTPPVKNQPRTSGRTERQRTPPSVPEDDPHAKGAHSNATERRTPEAPGAREGGTAGPPSGLDTARHAAAQRVAHQAEVLRQAVFPAGMAAALGLDGQVGAAGYRAYLDQLLQDAGSPTDPVEVMMIEQLAVAHFRIVQLHGSAAAAKGLEGVKIYGSLASRLLGEFRRTALALRVYQGRIPEPQAEKRLKVFRAAQ